MTTLGNSRTSRTIGRFELTDLIDERGGSQLWRATDTTLDRDVLVRLLPLSDPRALDLEAAAVAAAAADARNLVKVLDVLNTGQEVAVVNEFVTGRVLTDYLDDPLPPGDAARVALEVSRGLEAAHAAGIAHGRLRPSHVVIADNGEIKVAGLGIDGVLLGLDNIAGEDPLAADIHGAGSILYAALTGRWPAGAVEGVAAAPLVGRNVPPPARVLADVPESLDQICARSVLTIVPPRSSSRYATQAEMTKDISGAISKLGRSWSSAAGVDGAASTAKRNRLMLAGGIAAGVGVLGFAGYALANSSGSDEASAPQPVVSAPASSISPEPATERTIPIQSAEDFDPLGNGEENPGRVDKAIDDDLESSWRTVVYYNKKLGKDGVGLLLDLGTPQPVSAAKLSLVGNGTNLEIRTAMEKSEKPDDYKVLMTAEEAGEKVTLRAPRPELARYVLVWFTDLPPVDGGYRGGIRNVKILGQ